VLRIAAWVCACVGAAGCVHEPAAEICPPAGAGDLVITEIAEGSDPGQTWIEVYNATGGDLDLEGTVVQVVSVDGATDLHMLIRRPLPLSAGDYVVLGDVDDAGRPDTIDYGFGGDFSRAPPNAGAFTISACGTQVDRVVFDAIPSDGTWSYGDAPPTADGNDDQGAWCTGTADGTPGTGNPPCA
jgi:hypothetical protein